MLHKTSLCKYTKHLNARVIRKLSWLNNHLHISLMSSCFIYIFSCVSFSVSGSICTSCLKNMTRVRCIYCWTKGVKAGLTGRGQWTTPQALWAGPSDNSTHKERSVLKLEQILSLTEALFYWELESASSYTWLRVIKQFALPYYSYF